MKGLFRYRDGQIMIHEVPYSEDVHGDVYLLNEIHVSGVTFYFSRMKDGKSSPVVEYVEADNLSLHCAMNCV